jgi:hypothetical protein
VAHDDVADAVLVGWAKARAPDARVGKIA